VSGLVHTMKRGDTSPAIRFTLEPLVNLTGASVVFSMQTDARVRVINQAPAAIKNAPGGVVRYDWQPGNTAVAGLFRAEFKVLGPGGAVETYPNNAKIIVFIGPGI